MDELKSPGKPFSISKRAVWEAYQKGKGQQGRAGCRRGLELRPDLLQMPDVQADRPVRQPRR